jgi:hypothetical protein
MNTDNSATFPREEMFLCSDTPENSDHITTI